MYTNEPTKIFIIAGPSGIGKNVLQEKLCEKYPSLFYRLEQVTTRARRNEDENDYLFLNREEFEKVRNLLIGRTCIKDQWYGSIPDFVPGKIATVILNSMGIQDFINNYIRCFPDTQYEVLTLEKPVESITVKREGRDQKYLQQESQMIKRFSTMHVKLGEGEFVTPDMVISDIAAAFSLEVYKEQE